MSILISILISIPCPLFTICLFYFHFFLITIPLNLFLLFHQLLFQIHFLNLNYHKLNIILHQRNQKFNKIAIKIILNFIHHIIILDPFYSKLLRMEYVFHYIHQHINKLYFTILLIIICSFHLLHQIQIIFLMLLLNIFSLKGILFQPLTHPKFTILRIFHSKELFLKHNHNQ